MPTLPRAKMDDHKGREDIMGFLDSLSDAELFKVFGGSDLRPPPHVKGKGKGKVGRSDLRMDRQKYVPGFLNIQIQSNAGSQSFKQYERKGATLATLLVEDGYTPSREDFIAAWKNVMEPFGTDYMNKGKLMRNGLYKMEHGGPNNPESGQPESSKGGKNAKNTKK